jgi:voltage-gated potassium channel
MPSGTREKLGPVWEQAEGGRINHRLEPVILFFAILIVPVVLIEESHAAPALKDAAEVANWLIWIAFTLELLFVVSVAPAKRSALRAHWFDVLIVIITPPFLPGLLSFLRAARLVRLLRLTRLGVLGGRAIRSEHVFTSRQTFRYVGLLTILLVAIAGSAISVADQHEFPNVGIGMWWAITTATTVGYGDVVPHTVAGRLIASGLMLVGIGFLSMLTATIASAFVSQDAEAGGPTMTDIMAKLDAIEQRLELLDRR